MMDISSTRTETTSSSAEQGREETRRLVYALNALGVALSLKHGHVAARPITQGQPMPIEALGLIRARKEALLAYLTTPPEDTRPCAACGRPMQWTLCQMGIWVCDCYYQPELRTWPRLGNERKSAH
jgi:hypothetical protein